MENIKSVCENKTKDLLKYLDIKYSDISVSFEEETRTSQISIKGDDLGMLIGFHGKNLDALKTIISLMINKELGKDDSIRVIIDINDYSEKRKLQLQSMLENAKTVMAAREKSSYAFPPMNPADRRILHTLAQEMGMKTLSEGDGRNRHVNLIQE